MITDRIQILVDEKGITIAKMLKDLELGQGTFSTWKKRGTTPRGDILNNIANYLDVSVDYLLGEEEQKEKPITEGGDRLKLNEAWKLMSALSEEKQAQVFSYIQFLYNSSKDQ